ncbi:CotH kinase family protein [Bacteroides salyersiae]|nr:CotH kinase family protein [Bacteroides salyersiae]
MTFCVKDPDIEKNGERHKWISDYVNKAEEALLGSNFLDETEGYANYFDKVSFVDWYLINEITKNNDACFFSSCYLNITPGGKLKMDHYGIMILH